MDEYVIAVMLDGTGFLRTNLRVSILSSSALKHRPVVAVIGFFPTREDARHAREMLTSRYIIDNRAEGYQFWEKELQWYRGRPASKPTETADD